MAEPTKKTVAAEEVKGTLYQSLARNNGQIRQERADVIAEDLEITFKRGVEDMQYKLKRLKTSREGMFDFSPTNSQSLVLIKDLDAKQIHENDMKISIEIRQMEIELEIGESRYLSLFGKTI
jgi:hypothetical protein